LIKRKIRSGKLNPHNVGLSGRDIVLDCLAGLFQRDEKGRFPKIVRFFEREAPNFRDASEEDLLVLLRKLIFGEVNHNIPRIYSEADLILGRILRNIKNAINRTDLFELTSRFGEQHLVPSKCDVLPHRPPPDPEVIQDQFFRSVSRQDSLEEMLRKLHKILTEQEEFQRTIPLVSAALMVKQVYQSGWRPEESTGSNADAELIRWDITRITNAICKKIHDEMRPTYVHSGKCSGEVFEAYIRAMREIVLDEFLFDSRDGASYFGHLQRQIPNMTKDIYNAEHKERLERFAGMAKERVGEELRDSF
jgi:hypothetical protein